jgi:hypothetical protein
MKRIRCLLLILAAISTLPELDSCGGGGSGGGGGGTLTGPCSGSGTQPTVTITAPAAGAATLSGYACNVNSSDKIVVYALTNEWYVQPLVASPFVSIASDGSWSTPVNPWASLVALVVNQSSYTPAASEITNPALDPGVLVWTIYPSQTVTLPFSNYTWGIKTTGASPSDQFDPGPNYWSSDPSVVTVQSDGLHLKINKIGGVWQSGEVYLTQSLGYGTYTVQVSSNLAQLDTNTIAAPLFIYAGTGQELDNEYSGSGGLVPKPYSAQFVVQPYTVPGNIVYYNQPSTTQFTTQMVWRADHVTFTAWNGWASASTASTLIYQWTYTGAYIPPPGQERVHINLWLLNGAAPTSGTGDGMVLNSFAFQP